MSQMIKWNVTPACYEGLRCSVCSGYLSLAPIRLLPDGSALCCHCVPPNNEVPYRAVIVENLLSEATFPCRYKQFGCTVNVQFNKVSNHEDGCIHRPFPCASLPHTSCSWNGSASQVTGHFAEKHSDFVQQKAKLKFCVDQDKEGVLLVNDNHGSFIVSYAFNSTISSLKYQIRMCVVSVDSRDCTLQLFNDLDPDYSVNLKAKCFAYNTDSCNDGLLNIDVKSILAVLNNPTNFAVVYHVKLPTPTPDSSPNNEVDYKLLYSKRCGRCKYFLVPPLFDLSDKIICGDCSARYSSSKPMTNKTLENLLITQNFPCKWRGCNFIGNGGGIRRHQIECDFRLYMCKLYCREHFKRSCAKLHMEKHGCSYISDKYIDTFTFRNELHQKFIFTIVGYEIIVIEMKIFKKPNSCTIGCYELRICYSSDPASKLTGEVYFAHEHCKCKSTKFSIFYVDRTKIDLSDLPACFQSSDSISATIKINT